MGNELSKLHQRFFQKLFGMQVPENDLFRWLQDLKELQIQWGIARRYSFEELVMAWYYTPEEFLDAFKRALIKVVERGNEFEVVDSIKFLQRFSEETLPDSAICEMIAEATADLFPGDDEEYRKTLGELFTDEEVVQILGIQSERGWRSQLVYGVSADGPTDEG